MIDWESKLGPFALLTAFFPLWHIFGNMHLHDLHTKRLHCLPFKVKLLTLGLWVGTQYIRMITTTTGPKLTST